MPFVIVASGPSVRSCLNAARRVAGFVRKGTEEVLRNDGGDSLYRCELKNGVIVECKVILHSRAEAFILC